MDNVHEGYDEQHGNDWIEFARGGHDEEIRAFRGDLRVYTTCSEALWCIGDEHLQVVSLMQGDSSGLEAQAKILIQLYADISGLYLPAGQRASEQDLRGVPRA